MKRVLLLVSISLVLLLVLGSIGFSDEVKANKPYRIGVLLKTLANPFWVAMKEGTLKEAKQLGVKVDIYSVSTEGDIQAQLNLLETMIQKKYDGLAVAPITPVNLISGVVKATKLGIPVVNLDEAIDKKALEEAGGKIVSFVTTDNFKVGEQAAAYVVKMLGKAGGEVAIVEGMAGNVSGNDRRDGFRTYIEKTPNFKVVASQPADWDRVKALNVATNILQRFPNIKAIYACNDTMALGVAQAVITAGKQGKIIVVGTDGIPEAYEAIKQGRMSATIAQDPASIGATGLRLLVMYLNNPNDPNIPKKMAVPSKLITKEVLEK